MRLLATAVLFAFMVALSGAQDATDEGKLRDEIRAWEIKAATWGALRRLEITDEQARGLLDVAKKAAEARADYEVKLTKLREQQEEAFTSFRTEDIRNTGFTPKVENAAAVADHEEIALNKKHADRISELEKAAPLTEEQREMIAIFKPENPVPLFDRRDAPPLPPDLGAFVRKLRRLSDGEFGREKEELRNEFLRVIDARTRESEDLVACLARADEALKQIRALPDERVNRDVPRIVRKTRPRTKADRLREELAEIHKDKYGAIGPVGRFLLLPPLVEALSKRLGVKVDNAPVVTGSAAAPT